MSKQGPFKGIPCGIFVPGSRWHFLWPFSNSTRCGESPGVGQPGRGLARTVGAALALVGGQGRPHTFRLLGADRAPSPTELCQPLASRQSPDRKEADMPGIPKMHPSGPPGVPSLEPGRGHRPAPTPPGGWLDSRPGPVQLRLPHSPKPPGCQGPAPRRNGTGSPENAA